MLGRSDVVEAQVLAALAASEAVRMLGVEVMGFSLLSVRPTPEMARALEAEAREGLQRRADEAIYSRRNAAVEQERRIKESELSTELAVEEKRRQIREAQMAADIAVEEQRAAAHGALDARTSARPRTRAPTPWRRCWRRCAGWTGRRSWRPTAAATTRS